MRNFLYTFVLIFVSCQNDDLTETFDDSKTFNRDNKLFQFALRMTQEETSIDNVLDNSNCFKVNLPVTLIVNNQQITVNNANDYQLVQNAINQFTNDDDIVNFIYPISIRLKNGADINIINSDALDNILEDCNDDDDDNFQEIKCIKFKYPLTIYAYNKDTRNSNTIEFLNDNTFYNYLKSISNNVLLEFKFPITIIKNNQEFIFQNNESLEIYIEDNLSSCNQNINQNSLQQVISSGTWYVSFLTDDDGNITSELAGWNFTFNQNGTAQAIKNSQIENGSWQINLITSNLFFEIDFNLNDLEEVSENWKVIEYSSNVIRLKEDDLIDPDYLTLTKN